MDVGGERDLSVIHELLMAEGPDYTGPLQIGPNA